MGYEVRLVMPLQLVDDDVCDRAADLVSPYLVSPTQPELGVTVTTRYTAPADLVSR